MRKTNEYDETVYRFLKTNPIVIRFDESDVTVKYKHFLCWNNTRKYAFLVEYPGINSGMITYGVQEGDIDRVIGSAPLDLIKNEKILNSLYNPDNNTINQNPFYKKAEETGDKLMQKQIRLHYNLADSRPEK